MQVCVSEVRGLRLTENIGAEAKEIFEKKRVGDEARSTCAQAQLAECRVFGCLGAVAVEVCECVSV